MAVIEELIRQEDNGTISFGNHLMDEKKKVLDFEVSGDLYKIKTAIEEAKPDVEFDVDEITTTPQDYVELEGDDMMLFERLMDLLDDCDDVDQIFHNVSNYDDGEE